MPKPEFIGLSSGCLVRLSAIAAFDNRRVFLLGGSEVPVSQEDLRKLTDSLDLKVSEDWWDLS